MPVDRHIFLHLHKTGGVTLNKMLQTDPVYPVEESYFIDGKRYFESIDELLAWPVQKKSQLQIVAGHQWFGLHTELPGSSKYFSIVREPVARVVSLYNWAKERPLPPAHKKIVEGNLDLTGYLKKAKIKTANNGMTRMLAGRHARKIPYGTNDSKLLDLAWSNIENHFICVGITEKFDESLHLFAQILGWPFLPVYKRRNTTRHRSVAQPTQAQVELIESLNQLDIELYTRIKAGFEQQLAKQDSSFFERVAAYQRARKQAEAEPPPQVGWSKRVLRRLRRMVS